MKTTAKNVARYRFWVYLKDIMEYGPYKNQADAARALEISDALFSMILTRKRHNPRWAVGARIIILHAQVMLGVVSGKV